MKKICSIFSKVTQKINFKNILILYVIIFFLWNLPTFISKLNEYGVYALFTTIGFILIAIFCVCIIILIIFKMPDKITYFKKQIKIYGIKKGRKYKPYIYDDINEYPKVHHFNISWLFKYNSIIITDKFLDTSVDIVNIIKKYIPEANNKLLSNVLAYVKKYNNKLINRNKIGILPEEDRKPKKRYNSMNVKFENKDTVVFLSILHTTAYGITQKHHDYVQIYKIETNNNELLHEIKSLKLSPIFAYEMPLPWEPYYRAVLDEGGNYIHDKDGDELYEVKYKTIEEVFDNLNILDRKYKEWKEYVFEFFTEFDKLSYEKTKEFLKLTDYEIPEYWEDILLNKKYLKYIQKQ